LLISEFLSIRSSENNSLSPPEKEKKQSAAGRMVRGLGKILLLNYIEY